jgi:hypothetical protein
LLQSHEISFARFPVTVPVIVEVRSLPPTLSSQQLAIHLDAKFAFRLFAIGHLPFSETSGWSMHETQDTFLLCVVARDF